MLFEHSAKVERVLDFLTLFLFLHVLRNDKIVIRIRINTLAQSIIFNVLFPVVM